MLSSCNNSAENAETAVRFRCLSIKVKRLPIGSSVTVSVTVSEMFSGGGHLSTISSHIQKKQVKLHVFRLSYPGL